MGELPPHEARHTPLGHDHLNLHGHYLLALALLGHTLKRPQTEGQGSPAKPHTPNFDPAPQRGRGSGYCLRNQKGRYSNERSTTLL